MYEFHTALNQNTFISLKILEALMQKNLSDEDKAKIIAEGFAELETRYPNLHNIATKTNLSETELRLLKEIQELDIKMSKEIKELDIKILDTELRLTKEIKELDIRLTKEIKVLDIRLTKEIQSTKSELLKFSFLFWISQMIALSGIGFFVYKALKLGIN